MAHVAQMAVKSGHSRGNSVALLMRLSIRKEGANLEGLTPGAEKKGGACIKDYSALSKETFTAETEGVEVSSPWVRSSQPEAQDRGVGAYIFSGFRGWGVTITGCTMYCFVDGKCAEEWEHQDMVGALQQMGVFPPLGEGAG